MRARTGWGIGLAILGVLSLAAAAILAWVVVPMRKQLPEDTNTVRHFEGTAKVLLNPQALAASDFRNALATNVPVTADRTVKVLATDGGAAQVSDVRVLMRRRQAIAQTSAKYAVDRKTLDARQTGYLIRLAGDSSPRAYRHLPDRVPETGLHRMGPGYPDHDAHQVPARREQGRRQYLCRTRPRWTPRRSRTSPVLANLPPALPQSVLGRAVGRAALTDQQKAALAQALPRLANPVPLELHLRGRPRRSGLNPRPGSWSTPTGRRPARRASVVRAGLCWRPYPFTTSPPTSRHKRVADAANEASNKKDDLTFIGTTLPWILVGVGAVLLIAGLVPHPDRAAGGPRVSAEVGTDPRMPPQPGQPPQQPLPPESGY